MLHFEWSSFIPASVDEVFAFHEQPEALLLLTPPDENVSVVRGGGSIQAGSVVELRVGIFGPFAVSWIAHHTAYEKNLIFIDEQRKGPFASWVHEHRFIEEREGTRLVDSIHFALPGGPAVERLAGWIVLKRLRRLFAYRHNVTLREVVRRAE